MTRWTDEAEIGTPYWWQDLPPQTCAGTFKSKCDVLVIGAGYTGLSAAIAAHDCGADVCVVDAGEPGKGASTRNGGMFGAHPRLDWGALQARFGTETADGVFAEASVALRFAKDLIAREQVECDLQNTGRIQLAWTRSHYEAQKRMAESIQAKTDVAVEITDRAGLAEEINTASYFGGLVLPEHCGLHPAKYHAGLLAAVHRRGIPVVAQTPVTGLRRAPGGNIAQTPTGDIRAEKVILATNGYTPPQFGWHQKRVFPLPSFIIATEELPSNLIGDLAPGRRMMVETRARHSYFRISPDGKRILWGGRSAMVPLPLERAAARLRETMLEVWPELANVKLSHVWTGFTGYSFTHMPQVGARDGVHFAMGYSGSGTVLAPYLGAKAAYQALDDPRGETAYSNTHLSRHALHRFSKPYFLHAADFWYRNWVDRLETRQGRKGA